MKKLCVWLLVAFGVGAFALEPVDRNGYTEVSGSEMDKNLIADSGFEESGGKWHWPSGYRVEANAGRNGSTGLVYERRDPSAYPLPKLEVKLKGGVTYEFGVWIRTADLGEKGGAGACLEYAGRNGEYLGGCYLKAVPGNRDWTLVSGKVTAPQDAVCTVTPYLRKGTVGTAWWDDFYLRPLGDRWQIYAVGRTNNRVSEQGDLRLRALCNGAVPERESELMVQLELGGERFAGRLKNGEAEFLLPSRIFGEGEALIPATVLVLDPRARKILAQAELPLGRALPPAANSCVLDSFGVATVNGRKFMPRGFYTFRMNQETIRMLKDAGANVLMCYGSPFAVAPGASGVDGIRKTLDELDRSGLKVIFSVKDVYAGSRLELKEWYGTKGDDAIVERMVKTFRDHPALLAWYMCDESPLDMVPRLKKRRELLNKLDPHHPTWSVYYQFADLGAYAPTQDILGVDPYPIRSSATRNMQMVQYAMKQLQNTGVPAWVAVQAHNTGIYDISNRNGITGDWRGPDGREIRAMTLLMAGYGAKGFLFYALEDLKHPRLPKGDFERTWPEIKAIFSLLERLEPYITGAHSIEKLPLKVLSGQVEAFRLTADDGKQAVLICAIGPGEARAVWRGRGHWRSETGRTVPSAEGALFSATDIDSDVLWLD